MVARIRPLTRYRGSSPFGRGGGEADGEGKWWQEYALSPAIAGALPRGEPLGARNLRGGWALPEARVASNAVIQRRNWQ